MTEKQELDNTQLIEEDEVCNEIMRQHDTLFDDLIWDEFNVKEHLEKNPYHYQQYRMLWLIEKNRLHRIETLMEEYIGKLYDEMKYNGDKKLTKTEIERYYIPKDEKVKKFRKLHARQSLRTEVYEYIADSFKQQSFQMNSYVKAMQL